jgi:tetratricopeptide (TPR) repeat protein
MLHTMSRLLLVLFVAAFCPAGHLDEVILGQPAPSLQAASVQDLLAEAGNDLSAGRFEQAASRFRSILTQHPDTPDAMFGLAVATVQLGRLQDAEQWLQRYVELRPEAPEGHSVLGIVLLTEGKHAAARKQLEIALRLEPDNLEAGKALAQIEAGEYQGPKIVRLLQPFIASPEFDLESWLLLATGYVLSGEHRKALDLLLPTLGQQPPPPPEAFIMAASSAVHVGDGRRAAQTCILGLRTYLNSDQIEQRCLEVGRQGHLDEFVSRLESTLGDRSEDVPDLILLGRLMTDAGAHRGGAPGRRSGLAVLERAVALAPSNPSALYNLGRCLRVADRLEEAIGMLQRALEARPDEELRTLIYTQLGLAYRVLKQEAKTEDAFRRAFEQNRKAPRYLPEPDFEFHDYLQFIGRSQQAENLLLEILRRAPGFLPARLGLARSLAKADRWEEAAREAELVAKHADEANRPLILSAHLFLFRLYTKHGRKEEADRHREWLKEQ